MPASVFLEVMRLIIRHSFADAGTHAVRKAVKWSADRSDRQGLAGDCGESFDEILHQLYSFTLAAAFGSFPLGR